MAKKKKKAAKKSSKKSTKKAARKSAKKSAPKRAKAAARSVKKKTKAKAARKSAAPRQPRRTPAAAPPETAAAPIPPVNGGMDEGGVQLQEGDEAPGFELADEQGRIHSLRQYRGQTVVLYFYPKDDTPGCTTEACQFRDALGEFTTRNSVVLGVSPDSSASHQKFVQKFGLTFPLLVDEDHSVAERFGVWVPKSMYGRSYMGIARTTFVIDPDGRVAHIVRNVKPEGHDQEILKLLSN